MATNPPNVPPTVCCAARVCCSDNNDVRRAIRKLLRESMEESLLTTKAVGADAIVDRQSQLLMAHFDLVPRGVGEAIARFYKPYFDAAGRGNGKDAAGEGSREGL